VCFSVDSLPSTKVAIKMSRASGKTKDSSDEKEDSVGSDIASENDDTGQEPRQETPDLYRNSSLGMYVFF
jgi:E3 ubiquitin-protein ligase HUWE1